MLRSSLFLQEAERLPTSSSSFHKIEWSSACVPLTWAEEVGASNPVCVDCRTIIHNAVQNITPDRAARRQFRHRGRVGIIVLGSQPRTRIERKTITLWTRRRQTNHFWAWGHEVLNWFRHQFWDLRNNPRCKSIFRLPLDWKWVSNHEILIPTF